MIIKYASGLRIKYANGLFGKLMALSDKVVLDPEFGRKFLTGIWLFVAVIGAVTAAISGRKQFYYGVAGSVFFSISCFLFYGHWRRSVLASYRAECEKLYPPGTSEKKIQVCIYGQVQEARVRQSYVG